MPSIVFMYFIEMEMQRKRKNTHSNMINKPKVQQKKEKKKKSFWHCDALSVYIQGGSLLFSKCGFPELILKT